MYIIALIGITKLFYIVTSITILVVSPHQCCRHVFTECCEANRPRVAVKLVLHSSYLDLYDQALDLLATLLEVKEFYFEWLKNWSIGIYLH